jgi:hypothetical protein
MVIMIKINGSKNYIDPQAEPLLGAASGSNKKIKDMIIKIKDRIIIPFSNFKENLTRLVKMEEPPGDVEKWMEEDKKKTNRKKPQDSEVELLLGFPEEGLQDMDQCVKKINRGEEIGEGVKAEQGKEGWVVFV